jgi:DNA mismatch endonuclease (patch repair protein)
MQGNRSRDTTAELAVRRLAHAMGLRYLVNARPEPRLRRTADLVFRGPRVAVFIDGCFWHGCRKHCRIPATNRLYWSAKIDGNRERDIGTNAQLSDLGWVVLRFWAHEAPEAVVEKIGEAVSVDADR